ncbi:MAG TPA: energy transducer TonB [Hyphomonadaceae bacterium]|jgi:outer membrane biosynthesis protein TonB|nr:energy transducer TonB [Hyphomonadaceae bacterium]
MKLIHIAFGLVAASLLPTATADEPASKGKPFSISFASDVAPVSHTDFRYPSYAGVRDLAGSCDVTFDISAKGAAEAIDVSACSAHIFHSAAKNVVKDMTFAAKAQSGVKMKINWKMNEAAIKTASLN